MHKMKNPLKHGNIVFVLSSKSINIILAVFFNAQCLNIIMLNISVLVYYRLLLECFR